ncbi:MAG: sulfotransferase domain-containing protein [Symploca sp. SIO1C4]|uniref:Sulfotransferase domain-containing protein n=1 Tax=Symploca sp. SIO1C4 TaxID=2607765 RepID=A0A6B3MZ67_9CYAN|nr:sulfotransferase domain-containing protein [Symploca sp. SIO1C4]
MTLPNFLGIGAMRSGTTWLDKILRSHPDIYLPERRKEVHFFDQYYERGINWYQAFFPSSAQAYTYQNIGEITPKYLYAPQVPNRIREHLPNCRFIVILRNPADRAYSQYGFSVKNFDESRTFQEYFNQESEVFMRGLYSQQLKRYLQYFPLEKFLILIYEHTVNYPEQALNQLANFLGIDANKFDRNILKQRANPSRKVRFSRARALAIRFGAFLQSKDLDLLWNVVKNSGMRRIFEQGDALPSINPSVRTELISKYELDITLLEDLIGMDLSVWRKG